MVAPPNWLKFVSHDQIESHIEQGWRPLIPNAAMHHHEYGIEMGWFAEHEPPPVSNRVPNEIPQENAHDRAASGT